MTDAPSVASKTWQSLKRTASGIGGSKRRRGSLSGTTKDSPYADSVEADNPRGAQNGQATQLDTPLEHTANGSQRPAPSSREEFLEAYDAALLELANRTSGTEACCLEDIPLQDVAPWNRCPGFLVSQPQYFFHAGYQLMS